MLCHKERKVCIIRLFCRILITAAIYRYDSISILSNHGTPWVHAESSHLVSILLRSVYYLALIELIRQMCKYSCRKLYSDSYIYSVRFCRHIKILAHCLESCAGSGIKLRTLSAVLHIDKIILYFLLNPIHALYPHTYFYTKI